MRNPKTKSDEQAVFPFKGKRGTVARMGAPEVAKAELPDQRRDRFRSGEGLPGRMAALPDLRHNAAASAVTFGRDS